MTIKSCEKTIRNFVLINFSSTKYLTYILNNFEINTKYKIAIDFLIVIRQVWILLGAACQIYNAFCGRNLKSFNQPHFVVATCDLCPSLVPCISLRTYFASSMHTLHLIHGRYPTAKLA